MSIQIKDALNYGTGKLRPKFSATPELDAEVLLCFVLRKPKEYLYIQPDHKLTDFQIRKFRLLIARRKNGEPIAYIRGFKEFYGRNFTVNKNVLIPRPETELMIDEALEILKTENSKLKTASDIGTGSGCIAITLKKEIPMLKIFASDSSAKALAVAGKNAKIHKAEVIFKKGDLLAPLFKERIDMIVANLPYGDKKTISFKEVNSRSLKFEPKGAIFAGQNGLALYFKLIDQIHDLTTKPKYLLFEISPEQKLKIESRIKMTLNPESIETKKDLAGLDRIVIVKL